MPLDDAMSEDFDTSVIIAGGGPVGLALALELGLRDIPCVVVERRDGVSHVPKMSEVATRIMEFCRRWGIADEVRSRVWGNRGPSDFLYIESMLGKELGRQVYNPPSREQHGHYTPEPAALCPQIYFDPILARRAAAQKSVSIRYETTLTGFSTDEGGVTAILTDAAGRARRMRARYLVGCDGAAGIVRDTLGIPLSGEGVMARSVNMFFNSPSMITLHDKGWARNYRLIDEGGCWGEIIPINGEGLWRLTVFNEPESASDPERYLRRMFGGPFPYELINVVTWERRDFVAETYRRGRVFIAGDAAHQMSPTGGIGMATGIEEAVNLGWKLAAVLLGWGGPRLLDSYTAERRPNAIRNVGISTHTFRTLFSIPRRRPEETLADHAAAIGAWLADLEKFVVMDHVKVRFTYENSPICVSDGTPAEDIESRVFTPSARPGSRAPHVWLEDGSSIFDLFDEGFTLLCFKPGRERAAAMVEAFRSVGAPAKAVVVSDRKAAAVYAAGFALVRPDGHVAWRGDEIPRDPWTIVDRARGA